MSQPETASTNTAELRRLLVQSFSDNDLRSLCQDLGVDYDVLPGTGTEAKAREMIRFLERRGQLSRLVAAAARERPQVAWDSVAAGAGSAPATPLPGSAAVPAGARVTIRGNTLVGKANSIRVAQPDVSIEENLLAGQDQSIDVRPDGSPATEQP